MKQSGKTKRRVIGRDWKRTVFLCVFLAWPVLHWLVFSAYMNVQTVISSFQLYNRFSGQMEWVNFRNYEVFFEYLFSNNEGYGVAFGNIFVYIVFNIFVLLPVTIVIAYIFSRKFPGGGFFSAVYFFPCLISVVIMTMSWSFMWDLDQGIFPLLLRAFGIKDPPGGYVGTYGQTIVLLYCFWVGIGWNNLLLGGAMHQVSPELYEAAEIDGAGGTSKFFHVTLPSIWPTISTLIILGVASSFTIFLQPQLIANGEFGTITIALIVVQKVVDAGDVGLSAAIGVMLGIFGLIIVFLLKKGLNYVDRRLGYAEG